MISTLGSYKHTPLGQMAEPQLKGCEFASERSGEVLT
jgi:hypothetical protein